MNVAGLPASLWHELRLFLLNSGYATADELRPLFIDSRLISWQNEIPTIASKNKFVVWLISDLFQKTTKTGENGLLVLLYVLQGLFTDGRYHQCTQLIQKLTPYCQQKPSIPPDPYLQHLSWQISKLEHLISALMTETYLAERAEQSNHAKFEAILAKVPDVEDTTV